MGVASGVMMVTPDMTPDGSPPPVSVHFELVNRSEVSSLELFKIHREFNAPDNPFGVVNVVAFSHVH